MITPISPTPLDRSRDVHFGNACRRGRHLAVTHSADGVWTYARREDDGTTWTAVHTPTGRASEFHPTLRAARIATANGAALADLDREVRV